MDYVLLLNLNCGLSMDMSEILGPCIVKMLQLSAVKSMLGELRQGLRGVNTEVVQVRSLPCCSTLHVAALRALAVLKDRAPGGAGLLVGCRCKGNTISSACCPSVALARATK